ncbi:hypothetical protein MJG53_010803 [Ovis ammon polii x Ovis aries]|uniref:Uncharacterized protein n=1 Tax=Ovis ammon polii x Ovis aries TaxID=2918886 RepID=A0ACB9UQV7_9CETA|nr:hypothetical protein MJG53_010803 [Ovis ammon polii x Ovis aries]
MGRLHKYPKIHVITGEESSGSGSDSTQGLTPRHRRERNPEMPPWNSHGDWTFLRPPEWVPEVPVVLGPSIEGRGIPRGPRATRMGTGQSWDHKSGSLKSTSRGLPPRGRLQKYPKIHVNIGEESTGSGPDSTQGLRPRHRRERPPHKVLGPGIEGRGTMRGPRATRKGTGLSVLRTLAATQEVPRHTRLHSRGSKRVLPTSRGAPFSPYSSI